MLNDNYMAGGFDTGLTGAALQKFNTQFPTGMGSSTGAPTPPNGNMFGGFNADSLKLLLGGLQTIGNLYGAFQANKLARETFNFQKDFANTNLANQIKSYNTALSDRANTRAFTEGRSAESAQSYIDENKLTR